MKDLLTFFIKVGELKSTKRRGWVLRKIKDPETIAAHTFRTTIMAWFLCCKDKLNINKVLKMALIHDLCEVFAGDATPYDKLLPKDKKKRKKLLDKWPRLSEIKKKKIFSEKYKKEDKALKKLISKLPINLKSEIAILWNDYEKGLTKEGKFVRQLDRIENLLQALEYWKKEKKFKIEPWWIQIEELIDDPVLLEFMEALEKNFHQKRYKK